MHVTTLLNSLRLWKKFSILSFISLLVAFIPASLYLYTTNKAISAAQLEQEGIAPVAAMFKTIQLTQQHRGLAALAGSGSIDAAEKRVAKQAEADLAYHNMDALIAVMDNRELKQKWGTARSTWTALANHFANGNWTVADSYAAHTALIPQLLEVNDLVADSFGLQLDPLPQNYQLIQTMFYNLPYLTEESGKARAMGVGLLNKKTASAEEREALAGIASRAREQLRRTGSTFSKAANSNTELTAALGGQWNKAAELLQQMIALAEIRIARASELDYSASNYLSQATAAIDAQFSFSTAGTKELEKTLQAEVDKLRTTRTYMLVSIFLLTCLSGGLTWLIARSVCGPLTEAVEVALRISRGDLTSKFKISGKSETSQLMAALQEMNNGLADIVTSVRGSVDSIGFASGDISTGNNDLSARTENQASNLQQTAASMEQVTATVKQNAHSARHAGDLVNNAAQLVSKGGAVVQQVVVTMAEIDHASHRVNDIIGVIDGIAFQTNILALNAAVEAARAGDQGRGFAVVASEVRVLAQRSAAAAKEIKQLIGDSVRKIETGNGFAEEAGKAMSDVLGSVKHITAIMAEIVNATEEQSVGIEQINIAISQIDEMTQQNAALVEQSAAASESLKEQAKTLAGAVSVFSLTQPAYQG